MNNGNNGHNGYQSSNSPYYAPVHREYEYAPGVDSWMHDNQRYVGSHGIENMMAPPTRRRYESYNDVGEVMIHPVGHFESSYTMATTNHHHGNGNGAGDPGRARGPNQPSSSTGTLRYYRSQDQDQDDYNSQTHDNSRRFVQASSGGHTTRQSNRSGGARASDYGSSSSRTPRRHDNEGQDEYRRQTHSAYTVGDREMLVQHSSGGHPARQSEYHGRMYPSELQVHSDGERQTRSDPGGRHKKKARKDKR